MGEQDSFSKIYMHPELLSLLAENLCFCSDIGEALRAVYTGNDKALLKTICCSRQKTTPEDGLK